MAHSALTTEDRTTVRISPKPKPMPHGRLSPPAGEIRQQPRQPCRHRSFPRFCGRPSAARTGTENGFDRVTGLTDLIPNASPSTTSSPHLRIEGACDQVVDERLHSGEVLIGAVGRSSSDNQAAAFRESHCVRNSQRSGERPTPRSRLIARPHSCNCADAPMHAQPLSQCKPIFRLILPLRWAAR